MKHAAHTGAKLAGTIAVAWACLIAIFTLTLVAAYFVPNALVQRHVAQSVAYNKADEASFVDDDWSTDGSQSTFSIMLSMACHGGENPLQDAMTGSYFRTDELGVHGSILEGMDQPGNQSYEYYWNGWMVLLKPLLALTNYGGVKKLCWFAFFALMVLLALQMARTLKHGAWYAVALCAAFAMAGSNGIDMFPYALTLLLALGGSLFTLSVLARRTWKEARTILAVAFFCIGGLTAFLDFLITPAITVLLPLACFVLSQGQDDRVSTVSFRSLLGQAVLLGALWLLGYGGLWFSKWVLATAVLGTNVVESGINQVLFRTNVDGVIGHGDTQHLTTSRGDAIGPTLALQRNVMTMFPDAMLYLFAVLAALAALLFAFSRDKRSTWPIAAALAVCALLPFAWYLVVANHSTIHFMFTFRLQIATVFCVLSALVYFASHCSLSRRTSSENFTRTASSTASEQQRSTATDSIVK